MKIVIFTSCPQLVDGFLVNHPILRRSAAEGLHEVRIVNIGDYGIGPRKKIDDYSCGGGGMIMRADVLGNCIDENVGPDDISAPDALFVYMSARGVVLNQSICSNIARDVRNLYILCGRFEGVDQRLVDYYNMEELSIGDYVLTGGEVASLVLMEGVVRLIPEVIKPHTLEEESFSPSIGGMLEYDQFTRPVNWRNIDVPAVLLSGNHTEVRKWRLESSALRTTIRNKVKNFGGFSFGFPAD